MTIVWSRAALRDLNGIAAYLAERDPDRVGKVIARIMAVVARYSRFPKLGRQGPTQDTREIVVPGLPYIVAYRVRGEVFEVLCVRHTSRDLPT
ncbi:MAG: type II toxin-antitoxin system RelE/ParE family toxin [Chloroflexota bacterium]